MSRYILSTFVFFVFLSVQGQHLIGLPQDKIESIMAQERPTFSKLKVINDAYNYLKYQDANGEQTILIFLDNKNKCTSTKLMSHFAYMGDEVARLNKNFEKDGSGKWKYTINGDEFQVEMKKDEWFFSIITKHKEK